jgi:hypothetical protein
MAAFKNYDSYGGDTELRWKDMSAKSERICYVDCLQ